MHFRITKIYPTSGWLNTPQWMTTDHVIRLLATATLHNLILSFLSQLVQFHNPSQILATPLLGIRNSTGICSSYCSYNIPVFLSWCDYISLLSTVYRWNQLQESFHKASILSACLLPLRFANPYRRAILCSSVSLVGCKFLKKEVAINQTRSQVLSRLSWIDLVRFLVTASKVPCDLQLFLPCIRPGLCMQWREPAPAPVKRTESFL